MLNRYRIGGILVLIILLTLISCGQNGRRAEDGVTAHAVSSDLVRTDEHEDITWDLIQMAEHDPALKAMLEESVAQAYRMNPDPDTNPVSDLESYYAFLDRCYLCLPWGSIRPESSALFTISSIRGWAASILCAISL